MVISLCFVEGISNVDTPYFATKIAQEHFFDRHEVGVIQTSFYPPHYYNAIRVDSDDFDFNSQVNYLRFSYLNKYYYYFIRSIEYVNETLMEIEIEMDVIQTYMFNIETHGGVLERKFINRWIGDDINRNYLRENVSSSEFLLKSYKTFLKTNDFDNTNQDDESVGCIVITANDNDGYYIQDDYLSRITYNTLSNKVIPPSTRYLYFLPIGNETLYNIFKDYTGDLIKYSEQEGEWRHYSNNSWTSFLRRFITDNKTTEIFYIPMNFFNDVAWTNHASARDIYCNCKITSLPLESIYDTVNATTYKPNTALLNAYTGFVIGNYDVKPMNYSFSFDFMKNTSTGTYFDYRYMPILLDENYYRVMFGDVGASSTLELFRYYRQTFICSYIADITLGKRIYRILSNYANFDGSAHFNSPSNYSYDNTVVSEEVMYIDLVNDAWVTWNQYNRATIPMAMTGYICSAFASYSNINANSIRKYGGTTYNNAVNRAYSEDAFIDKRVKYPDMSTGKGLNKRGKAYLAGAKDYYNSLPYTATGSSLGSVSSLAGVATQEWNAWLAPNTVKSVGTINTSFLNNGIEVFLKIFEKEDIQVVANWYHRNGYLVNEYVNVYPPSYNIFTYVQNRYYFNVLKLKDSDVTLINVINDESTIMAIKDRLEMGLRLWNLAPNGEDTERTLIGNYALDNVEIAYLGG